MEKVNIFYYNTYSISTIKCIFTYSYACIAEESTSDQSEPIWHDPYDTQATKYHEFHSQDSVEKLRDRFERASVLVGYFDEGDQCLPLPYAYLCLSVLT